jgi:hypothetical protein
LSGVVADFISDAYVPCFMHGIQWMITIAGTTPDKPRYVGSGF